MKTYTIAGATFTAPPPVARQEKWILVLMREFFKDGKSISESEIIGVLSQWISRIAAILLVPDNTAQATKVEGGIQEVERLEAWLDTHATMEELGAVASDFFTSGRLLKLIQGVMQPMRQFATLTPSMPSSARSPMGTFSGASGSGRTSDSTSVAPTSSAVGSGDLPSAPSLGSAASNSPG